jgi:uncharacterized protein (DUF427 family)
MSTVAQSLGVARDLAKDGHRVRVEPTDRWVRGERHGDMVVDSRRALLVLPDQRPPTYYFPKDDVGLDLLSPCDKKAHFPLLGETRFWNLGTGDDKIDNAAFEHIALPKSLALLEEHLAFNWASMDHWYEEDEEVFVHARNPYTRIDAIQSSRHIRVEVDGQTVANSYRPVLLFETGLPTRYYLPKEDIRVDWLIPTDTHTRCPYKGTASYWALTLDARVFPDLIWGYPDPIPESGKIKDLLCFYNEKVDIYVDDVLQPRPETPWS